VADPVSVFDEARDGSLVPQGDLWVFGYGSLMWDPCFAHSEVQSALLHGYHRAFCVYSHRSRGTRECPGLVLGLNPGGACRGLAFRVEATQVRAALHALWAREMTRRTYAPRMLEVRTARDRIRALTFVADPQHYAYAGKLELERMVAYIAQGRGERGHNIDYLRNTLMHLRELGVRDRGLAHLLHLVEQSHAAKIA